MTKRHDFSLKIKMTLSSISKSHPCAHIAISHLLLVGTYFNYSDREILVRRLKPTRNDKFLLNSLFKIASAAHSMPSQSPSSSSLIFSALSNAMVMECNFQTPIVQPCIITHHTVLTAVLCALSCYAHVCIHVRTLLHCALHAHALSHCPHLPQHQMVSCTYLTPHVHSTLGPLRVLCACGAPCHHVHFVPMACTPFPRAHFIHTTLHFYMCFTSTLLCPANLNRGHAPCHALT